MWKSFSLQFPFLQDLGSSIPSCLGWPELQFRSPLSGETVSTPRSLLDLFAVYCEWVNALQIKALEEVQLTSECWLSLSKVLTTLVALWYLHTGLFCFDRFIVVFQLFFVELARYQPLYHRQAHASPILWIWRDSSPFWLNLVELNLSQKLHLSPQGVSGREPVKMSFSRAWKERGWRDFPAECDEWPYVTLEGLAWSSLLETELS